MSGFLLGASTALLAQQPPPAPFIREHTTTKLSEHVWAIPDFNVGGGGRPSKGPGS